MSDRHFFNGRRPGSRSRNGDGAASHLFGDVSQRLMTSRQVRQNIVSLVGLIGAPVLNQSGEEVGRLVDMVAQVHGNTDPYPALTGIVVRVGRRRAFLDASAIDRVERRSVTLRTARLDLREFHRREGEVLLHRDILDHQLVDTDEVQVIRAADLYLAQIGDQVQLVGVDVSLQTLLRRLGPKRFRWHPTPDRVIDWAAIESFGADSPEAPAAMKLREPHSALRRLRPAELADVLEELEQAGPEGAAGQPRPRPRRGRPGGDGAGRADRPAARDGARAGRRAGRADGTRRGGRRAARACPGPSRHSFWPTCQRPPSGNSPACSATPKTRPRAS